MSLQKLANISRTSKNTPIDEEPEQVVDELEPAPDLESWNETDW